MFPAFIHYSDASSRKAIRLLRGRFGDLGEAAWWRFLEILNQNDGGPVVLDDNKKFLVAEYLFPLVSDPEERENKMMTFFNYCASYQDEEGVGLIDTEMWKEGKLWNEKNIQNVIKKLTKKSPRQKKIIAEDDPILILCKQMISDVQKLFPKLIADPKKWFADIETLVNENGFEEVKSVWNWLQYSSHKQATFWKTVIRSANKFRARYGELHGWMNQNKPKSQPLGIDW